MKRLLTLALFASLPGGAAHAQALSARPDSATHRQGVIAFQQTINAEFRSPEESPLTTAER
ncbi:hypothetical protein [Hymenobacter daeguensis]